MITPPTTGTELTELKTGDVLGIYDFTVFVSEATATTEGFTGKGFVRMPFLKGALVLADFSGVRVWKSDGNGGCVYKSAHFESKGQTQEEIASARSKLMTTLAGQNSPNTYAGTLAGALQQYDALSAQGDSSQICQYKAAILQASQVFKDALEEAAGEDPDARVTDILNELATITTQLQTDTIVPSLTQKYEALFAKLELLKKQLEEENTPPDYQITNIALSNLQTQSARIGWQLSGGEVTRYVVEYRDPAGATLIESLDTPQVNLQRLKENTTYRYTILAYQGDKVVATSTEGHFTTLPKEVPRPENLAYTVLSNNSVKITWDKNTQHKDFKLVYTDGKGNWQAVFPTTNEVTLTGLDPSQLYDYEIVAYDNARLESAANNSQVTTAEQCKLDVSVVNARNSSHFSGNTHVLTATGCLSSTSPNQPTSIQWSNGALGTINENGTITFTDGEVGRMPYYPLTRSIEINPTTNKSYIAICTMGSGTSQKICTYTVDVKVLTEVCGTNFRIEASEDTFDIGDPVSLSAIGCEGQVRWSGAFGSGSKVEIYPKENIVVSASCYERDNRICYSNSINLTTIECVNWVNIKSSNRYEKIKFFTGGKLVKKVTYSEFEFITEGCYNEVEWRKDGDGKEENNITHVGESYKVKDSRGYLAVHARCLPALPDGYCSWVGLGDLSLLTQDCGGYSLSYDKESLSTALNKIPIGLVTIRADTKEPVDYLLDSNGNDFSPDSKQNFYVPLLSKSAVYMGYPPNGDRTCMVSVEVPGIRKFRINWDKTRLKAAKIIDENTYDFSVVNDERIDMSFKADGFPESNCTGTIVWTNNIDPDFKSTGEFLTLISPPTRTTTYYAACHFNNGDNTISIYPADNGKTIVIRSESCLTVKHDVLLSTNAISKGQKISFNVTGCGDQVTWTLGNQVIGLGRIFTHTPIPSQASVLTYKASCNFPACSQNVSINVTNCNFKIPHLKPLPKLRSA